MLFEWSILLLGSFNVIIIIIICLLQFRSSITRAVKRKRVFLNRDAVFQNKISEKTIYQLQFWKLIKFTETVCSSEIDENEN